MKNILGISCYFHDSSACLMRGGKIIAAAQEERFSRVKHDPSFPFRAINYCLEEGGIDEDEIDVIAFYENTHLSLDRVLSECKKLPQYLQKKMFSDLWENWRGKKIDIETSISNYLPRFQGVIKLVEHHQAHAAAAFLPSPFSEAAILTVDGVGEWATSSINFGKESQIEMVARMNYPNSVGLLYSAVTNYLGFKVNSGEYKVMGLAPYGDPKYLKLVKTNIVEVYDDGSICLNKDYFNFSGQVPMATSEWGRLFKAKNRDSETELTRIHFDVAASIQRVTEEIMVKMAKHARKLTGARNLCMSGGVALNCVANGIINRENIYEKIWIQPASGDAGNALGAAMQLSAEYDHLPRGGNSGTDLMQGSLLGPSYSTEEICDFLDLYDLRYKVYKNGEEIERTTDLIEEGKVIGLFDGRMEFGPRALGARSIIADARSIEMQQYVNRKIKFRESFRPFAPVVREENVSEWFELECDSRYMLLVAPVKPSKRLAAPEILDDDIMKRLMQSRSAVAAVTHVDYSARVQTVPQESTARIRKILDEFNCRTKVPILINTSFNLRSEPIVATPMDAYRCMMRSQIDAILLENVLVLREDQPEWKESDDWKKSLAAD